MPPPLPPPAKRRGTQSTQIPDMPDFKLGYAEKEREMANQRVQDRKTKTGKPRPENQDRLYSPLIHFAVGVAHFHWDELAAGEGNWTAATNQWSVDEDNRDISSQRLLDSILKEMRLRTKRDNLTKWLHPGGLGDWTLGHTNPTKLTPRDIVTWDDARLLSEVIDAGSYEQRVLTTRHPPETRNDLALLDTKEASDSAPSAPPPPSTPPTPLCQGKGGGGGRESSRLNPSVPRPQQLWIRSGNAQRRPNQHSRRPANDL
jgi:hypothetical protein